jgi:cell wall-associated NlpC family hydrolase
VSVWWADYIGIPFAERGYTRAGCNCWGLAHLVWAEQRGIYLPTFGGRYQSVRDGDSVQAIRREFEPLCDRIEVPEPLDIVLFDLADGSLHVGLVIDQRFMLHVEEGLKTVREPMKKYPHREGFYRPC